VEVVFPGKEFMIEKYGLQSKEQRVKNKDGKKNTSSYHHIKILVVVVSVSLVGCPLPMADRCGRFLAVSFKW